MMTTLPHYLTTLDYLPLENICIPSQMPSNKLMIILHGRGGMAEDFTWIADKFNFDDMHYLLLNAPEQYDNGYSWYLDFPHHKEGIQHSCTKLQQTFDILFEKDFNASESFLFGFSQGALLTFECGARYRANLAGYIAISGHLADPEVLLKQMNIKLKHANWLCTHGVQDEALDFKKAQEQIKFLQNHDFNIQFHSYNKAHTIIEEEIEMIQEWIQLN
jgi:phospholipase/carboxylesterase